MQQKAIIVFIRSPGGARVKSRLAESIGDERAQVLYRFFVEDLLDTVVRQDARLRVYYEPSDAKEDIARWLGDGYALFPQRDEDLGAKMRQAFEETFEQGYHSALLIGSDVPDLPDDVFREGFGALPGHDAVLGPSMDGGYYLVGFRDETFRPEIFEGIPWSTNMVFQKTLEIFISLGDAVHILPVWRDIDVVEDLKALMHRHGESPFRHSRTLRYLLNQKDFIRQD
ncbi:MAG TPA: TIGR04282 family arsenosugar biosynthesis glycosyltransferase [Syntrophales bacterium]|nr:TIGR04282 family arsenosugar biosynthesis glycosyltransferase [Syntrophales bacterium]HQM29654.1 TIGR04282 family arsenosugar biosynthesis glycosyltransferase [Syntrophales bacterium]